MRSYAQGENLNSKRVLRFYFSADNLNAAMNNLIEGCACLSRNEYEGWCAADKIIALIEAKRELSLLWGYLNGVMEKLEVDDISTLCAYALMRTGISKLNKDAQKNVRRVVTKFTRRARQNISRFEKGLKLLDSYYCLVFGEPSAG
jgi:hypothetical protein